MNTELAELAVTGFHESYNKGSFDTIYVNASPEFQDFVTKIQFSRLLEKLQAGLGRHQSSNLVSWSTESSLLRGNTVTLIYDTTYENDAAARESFTFKVMDGFARLYNFNVSSKRLSRKPSAKANDV